MSKTDAYPMRPPPGTGFEPGLWQKEINVRAFIQRNVAPYDGDAAFLAGGHGADAKDLGAARGAVRRGA